MSVEDQRKLETLINQLTVYNAQVNAIQNQIEVLTVTLSDVNLAIETIRNLSNIKIGTEILVPIGANSYIKTKVVDNTKVVVGLGSNVAAQKSVKEAEDTLTSRLEEIERLIQAFKQKLVELGEEINKLQPETQRLLEKLQSEGEHIVESSPGESKRVCGDSKHENT